MDIENLLPRRIGYAEFELESVGRVIVSTIELPAIYQSVNPRSRYETAIIWDRQHAADDGYHIASVCVSVDEAMGTHQFWCNPRQLEELVAIKVSAGIN